MKDDNMIGRFIAMFSTLQIWFILASCTYQAIWFVTVQSETTIWISKPDIRIQLKGQSNRSRIIRLRDYVDNADSHNLFTRHIYNVSQVKSRDIGTLVGLTFWDYNSDKTKWTLSAISIRNEETLRRFTNVCRCVVETGTVVRKALSLSVKPNKCPSDRFGIEGNNCSQTCRCEREGACRLEDGACVHGGCLAGWTAEGDAKITNCQASCPRGSFGEKCAFPCNCTVSGRCDPVTGACRSYKSDEDTDDTLGGLTFEEIIGVSIGVIAFIVLLVLMIYCLVRYVRTKRLDQEEYFGERVQMEISPVPSSESLESSVGVRSRSVTVSFHSTHCITGYDKTRDVRQHKKSKLHQHLQRMREKHRQSHRPRGILRKIKRGMSIKDPKAVAAAQKHPLGPGRWSSKRGIPWGSQKRGSGKSTGTPTSNDHKHAIDSAGFNLVAPPPSHASGSNENVAGPAAGFAPGLPGIAVEHMNGDQSQGPSYLQWHTADAWPDDDDEEDSQDMERIQHIIDASKLRRDSIAVAKIHGVTQHQEQQKGKIGEFFNWMAHPHLPNFGHKHDNHDHDPIPHDMTRAPLKGDGGGIGQTPVHEPVRVSKEQRKLDHMLATRYDVVDIELNEFTPADLPEDFPSNFPVTLVQVTQPTEERKKSLDKGTIASGSGKVTEGAPTKEGSSDKQKHHEKDSKDDKKHKHGDKQKVRKRRTSQQRNDGGTTSPPAKSDKLHHKPSKETRKKLGEPTDSKLSHVQRSHKGKAHAKKKKVKRHRDEPTEYAGGPSSAIPPDPKPANKT